MTVEVTVEKRPEIPAEQVGTVGVATVTEALKGWASDRAAGLGFRFTHAAFSKLGYRPRSASYQRKQGAIHGTTLPFVGVRGATRFRDLVLVPGALSRVEQTGHGTVSSALLTVQPPKGLRLQSYLEEWARLAQPEEVALLDRLEQTMTRKMEEALNG